MIFISYSWSDWDNVQKIVRRFNSQKLPVWIDYENIDLSKPIENQILSAIKRCHFFLMIISENSIKSDWVRFEFHFAQKIKPQERIFIYPIQELQNLTTMKMCSLHQSQSTILT